MKIVVAGGSGFVGTRVVDTLVKGRHSVILLTRNPSSVKLTRWPEVHAVRWDGGTLGAWAAEVDGADAVLNFAGESIGGGRWTEKRKEEILNSRVNATRVLVDAIRRARKRPSVLINASAVGYYGSVEKEEVTETNKRGTGFLADVCEQWENEARNAEQSGARVVVTRTGVVIGKNGGALERMALPFKMFAGGPVGSGKQWFPWIHIDDVAGIVLHVLQNSTVSGPINIAAPDIVTMGQFSNALGRAMNRPSWAPVPAFVLKLALGEMSDMLLTGQRVIPAKVTAMGYKFLFPKLDDALGEIFS